MRRAPALLALALAVLLAARPAEAWEFSPEQLKIYEEFTRGDLVRENPPALDRPQFIPAADASLYLDRSEAVFVLENPPDNGQPLVFPQKVLVHHGVCNLRLGGARLSVTYSPLAGAAACWLGKADVFDTTFGPTGRILNSVMLMYDRSTLSTWIQHTGIAIKGKLAGQELAGLPLLWTTWRNAFAAFPQARVLSRQTGFKRDYGRDPYGSYQKPGTYYDTGGSYFPLTNVNLSLPAKARILGVRSEKATVAIVLDAVREARAANVPFGLTPLAAFWDPDLETARVYSAALDGDTLHFTVQGAAILDQETRSTWDVRGRCTEGRLRGRSLAPVIAVPSMWFAWTAFFPRTMVFE
ncbi:MAG: DUF3179 domain-containing protein [Thermodesulfobacteriota bacterium]